MRAVFAVLLSATILTGGAHAAAPTAAASADAALELAKKAIALRSVKGPGNQTPQVAALYKAALVAGGFADADVEIVPVDDTAYLIGTWRGSDPSLKPMVISGHMDVVEAKPADWKRDPFTPVVENGYLYGRGATDMKLDGTIAITALTDLRRSGYKPKRSIVIEFSGDEETAMKTSTLIAERLKDANIVLNVDGGGGVLDEATGKPKYWTWNGAEKTYADFRLTVTNPGGHSSMPRPVNAIVELSKALEKVGAYQFKPELSPLTREALTKAAPFEEPAIGAALKAYVADPTDKAAIATLTANPATVGKIGTTCVPTLVNGGHAENALPQRATANINCRIFPGHKPADIMAELGRVIADPSLTIADVSEGSVANDASPMRPDFIAAITRAMGQVYPGVPVFPAMASGASDSMWFRSHHVASYGASPTFIKPSDDFSHGLDERTPIATIEPGIRYYKLLFTDLSK
ncbi:M20/M25/M40 family metallo-hydrolase [Sphingomonas sp. 10B4]|uniref:M20/M25/M40 family metallo-hydrolase n=1 Tax=Sphingomonas sp. 10B4 TaxID=3048575 RepID=UPI002AB4DFF8|nr:M20/M25/M40 family metallo-hydrolase [Sphingomonas sp. 10B4]MDY7525821.1 M20/M25/M40 family metallo-hydrolase [Sphingomonas sp. 10B4]MEB0281635.1 M20/M25/M40 family metallo-hydrolase [Sphingomonas sp. 10B4]